jgi:hypothetical protein
MCSKPQRVLVESHERIVACLARLREDGCDVAQGHLRGRQSPSAPVDARITMASELLDGSQNVPTTANPLRP